MNYIFHENTDIKQFDAFVMQSEQNTLFQCSPWADIKNNWDHRYTSVTLDGTIVATALVLIRKMPLGKTLFYIPRGPIMDYHNHDLVDFYFENLRKLAKKNKAIALRFDPAVLSRKYAYENRKEDNDFINEDVIRYLKKIGAKHKGFTKMIAESTQPRFNAQKDITPDYREKLHRKTKKMIRDAEHKGIKLYQGHEYLKDFCTAMHYTEVRKGVALRNEEYFKNMLEVYGDHAMCMVTKLRFPEQIAFLEKSIQEKEDLIASGTITKKKLPPIKQELENDKKEIVKLRADYEREGKDEVITAGILAVYNDTFMELFYMGNNPDYLRTYSSYLLYATCLDKCVEEHIETCSFGGIEGTLKDGLTIFKSNWAMNVEEYIGEFNFVLDPIMYSAFDSIYPFILKTAAKIRGNK